MKLVTGIDLVDVDRLSRMIQESTAPDIFLGSSWTPSEVTECQGDPARLAGRWAAKEATLKALGTGIGPHNPLNVEVDSSDGPPRLILMGGVADLAALKGIRDWSVSISHEDRYAVAVVVGTE